MDPRPRGVPDRVPGGVDVGGVGAREAGDDRALDLAGDRLDGLEVAGRGDREAGLDDVDAEPRELVGDLELLGGVERDAGRLLAVAQRRVEDQYSVGVLRCHVVRFPFGFACTLLLGSRLQAAATRYSPRRGRSRRRSRQRERHVSPQRSSGRPGRTKAGVTGSAAAADLGPAAEELRMARPAPQGHQHGAHEQEADADDQRRAEPERPSPEPASSLREVDARLDEDPGQDRAADAAAARRPCTKLRALLASARGGSTRRRRSR